jgi:hypothetical protein
MEWRPGGALAEDVAKAALFRQRIEQTGHGRSA